MNHKNPRNRHATSISICALVGISLAFLGSCSGSSTSNSIDQQPRSTRSRPVSGAAISDLHVASQFNGPDGGTIRTTVVGNDGRPVPHGLQVTLAADGWMQLVEVYDRGELRERTQLHRNGFPFRFQSRGGTGTENFESVSDVNGWTLYHGVTRNDEPWFGMFLVREWIPESQGRQRLMLYEYRNGERIGREAFPIERLGLDDDELAPDGALLNVETWPLRDVDMEQ